MISGCRCRYVRLSACIGQYQSGHPYARIVGTSHEIVVERFRWFNHGIAVLRQTRCVDEVQSVFVPHCYAEMCGVEILFVGDERYEVAVVHHAAH